MGYGVVKVKVLDNKNKMSILGLIRDKPLTISAISKKLELNYKTIWGHIKTLEEMNFVTLKQEEKEPGKPVYVSINKNDLTKLVFKK